jgi:Ca2+-transporting ATPase
VPSGCDQQTRPAWHATDADKVLAELDTDRQGLSDAAAAARLAKMGPNRLPPPPSIPALAILGNQLRSVVVALLIAATLLSLLIGDRLEAAAIATVLLINAALGFATEWRARRAMEALLQLEASHALVKRSGRLLAVPAEALVPGDIVQLDAGNRVPADVRLLEAVDLSTDEAPLTGESLPADKHVAPLPTDTQVADRANMAYLGTTIVSGTALAVVVSTGTHTELGRIGALVNAIEDEPTPLERRLDDLGRRLAWLTIALSGVVAGAAARNGAPWDNVLETGIALAVAAMPEALPAVATIALAVGMRRMVRRHALVRRLPAVESLGSATVVCTDKTRTLTTGRMTVEWIWTAGREFRLHDGAPGPWPPAARAVLETAAEASQPPVDLAGTAHGGLANPVDVAILEALSGGDGLRFESPGPAQRSILPFSSARKMMATFRGTPGSVTASVKGAPMAVLPRCSWIRTAPESRALDDAMQQTLQETQQALARSGLRMLAVASGSVVDASEGGLIDLVFEGFVGITDPVAPGVPRTVALLGAAGLRTVMITGDQRATAEAVGRAVGLIDGPARIIEGRDLSAMTTTDLAARVSDVHVFSRVSPEHKLLIVEALQQQGEIVAMLGDGVNDAAALKKADVGVAMGVRGTDAAKQAAAIVLTDDRFETVAAAVEEGRVIFDNIRKFVFYLFSCNVAEVLVLLVASLAGLPLPLTPLQLLWLNMVTDTFPALALAMEPGDATVMLRPPRDPQEAILSPVFVSSILVSAGMITAVTLGAYWSALRSAPDHASTIAFMTLALAQIAHLGNARSDRHVLAPQRVAANGFALLGVAMAVALQLLTTTPQLARVLDVAPLDTREWLSVAAWAALPAVIGQLWKLVRSDRFEATAAATGER